ARAEDQRYAANQLSRAALGRVVDRRIVCPVERALFPQQRDAFLKVRFERWREVQPVRQPDQQSETPPQRRARLAGVGERPQRIAVPLRVLGQRAAGRDGQQADATLQRQVGGGERFLGVAGVTAS